jgi:hypothetical protein
VRKIHLLVVLSIWFGLCATLVQAANYKLSDGRTVTGEIIESGSNDATALINVGDNKYERVPWGQFSQEDLKAFLTKYAGNKKIIEAVEPFIEVTQEERAAHTEVKIKPPAPIVEALQKDRAERGGSVIGSLFKSGLGLFLVLLIYAANVYAGYEISIFRAQPPALVAGLAAIPVLGFISNIVFVCLPTRVERKTDEDLAFEAHEEATTTIAIPGQEAAAAEAAAGAAAGETAPQGPKPEVFARGKFTFNKRFFETKFAGFFGVVRREEDKAKVLIFKSAKGEFVAQRITRITASEIYIQADRGGGASVEMSFQFAEIQEVVLQPHA